MFSKPTLLLRHNAAQTQRHALLAQQRIAAIAGAVRVDLHVDDVVADDCVGSSDGIVLYPYDKRMCYFDAVIEEF